MSDLYLGAYWGPRKESAECCAERVASCIANLSIVNDVFADWYQKGNTRRDALRHPIREADILKLLKAGRNRSDTDRSIIDDLGFRISIWNGASDERAVSLSANCGLYTRTAGLLNAVVLGFPRILGELAQKELAAKVLVAVVKSFEPEWAGIISHESIDARDVETDGPIVDWMIYLNRSGIAMSKLPPSASVIPVGDQGVIVITQNHPINASNPRHVENVRAVEAALFGAGN